MERNSKLSAGAEVECKSKCQVERMSKCKWSEKESGVQKQVDCKSNLSARATS